jgi:hypothetical protein
MSHLLVEFSGLIVPVQTNVAGQVHDSTAANHNTLVMEILGDKLALADPGYARVPFVVAGLKSNQVKSIGATVFDRVSRSEQVIVEHVNGNLKRYNWMLLNFDK